MVIYNEDKTEIIENPDLSLGKLLDDTIEMHEDAIEHVDAEGHYETVAEYENGGKDVVFVVDVPEVVGRPERTWQEPILVYILYTEEELEEIEIENLRIRRENECFKICDRAVWYDCLTAEQKKQVKAWRKAWLDVTETKEIPEVPSFIENI